MNDPAIVPGLMSAGFVFLVENQQSRTRKPAYQVQRGGQADDTGSDDGDIALGVARGHEGSLVRRLRRFRIRTPGTTHPR